LAAANKRSEKLAEPVAAAGLDAGDGQQRPLWNEWKQSRLQEQHPSLRARSYAKTFGQDEIVNEWHYSKLRSCRRFRIPPEFASRRAAVYVGREAMEASKNTLTGSVLTRSAQRSLRDLRVELALIISSDASSSRIDHDLAVKMNFAREELN